MNSLQLLVHIGYLIEFHWIFDYFIWILKFQVESWSINSIYYSQILETLLI